MINRRFCLPSMEFGASFPSGAHRKTSPTTLNGVAGVDTHLEPLVPGPRVRAVQGPGRTDQLYANARQRSLLETVCCQKIATRPLLCDFASQKAGPQRVPRSDCPWRPQFSGLAAGPVSPMRGVSATLSVNPAPHPLSSQRQDATTGTLWVSSRLRRSAAPPWLTRAGRLPRGRSPPSPSRTGLHTRPAS